MSAKNLPRPLDTHALMQPGTQLLCEMADFDACDLYRLRIDEVGEVGAVGAGGLGFSHGFCNGEEAGGKDAGALLGPVRVAAAALDTGDGVLFLSQGSVSAAEAPAAAGYATHTPPFLVSRKILADLKAGRPGRLTIYGDTAALIADGTGTVRIDVGGDEVDVPVVQAADKEAGMSVQILDDETWPLLLSAEFQGDNYITLSSIHPAR